jgi:hypothetical protein
MWKGAGYTGKRAVEAVRLISIDGITQLIILFQITIGADDDIINLWRYAFNDMGNQAPAFELYQPLVCSTHAPTFAASENYAADIWM